MNKISGLSVIIFLLILAGGRFHPASCQSLYKGPVRHAPPTSGMLPDHAADYDIHTLLSGPLNDSLHQTAARLFSLTNMTGLSVALLIPGKGLWQLDTGYISQPAGLPVTDTSVFYWASVGKLITATVIEQLIREKKLTHTTPLSKWFPQFKGANAITIDHLLLHTSGIYSFNNDPATFSLSHYYTPDTLLQIAAEKKPLFKPGQYWSYSNTGYLLLALIAEQIEGISFARIVQQRIAAPLHLASLRALEPRELPANLALAHAHGSVVREDYSVPVGAGNIVSNATDMVVLLLGLLTGKLSDNKPMQERLQDLYPMADKGTYYGRGIMLWDFSEITGTPGNWIGHSGGTETYRALLVYDVTSKSFIALATNQHISVEAFAMKMLGQISK